MLSLETQKVVFEGGFLMEMDKGSEAAGGKGKRKKKIKMLSCYKCGKPVTGLEEECPHCGATAPKYNPAMILRVVLGIVIAVILWFIFMK